MNDRQYKDEEVTELELSKSDIVLPVNIEGMEEAYRRFQQVKSKLMVNDLVKYNQYGYIAKDNENGKEYIVKSGWRKIATAFNISIDMNVGTPQKIYGEDKEGKYYTWLFPVRAIAPNGKYIDSIGACSSRKAFFSKKNNQRIDPQEEDIILMAQTVGINRAISDLVGGGEVSGEEMAGKIIHNTPNPEPTTQPQQQQSSDYGLDPDTYIVNFGKYKGKKMIDTDSHYLEWLIDQSKISTYKQTKDGIPMNIWIEFLEVCLKIHQMNKENPQEFADIEQATPQEIEAEYGNKQQEIEPDLIENFEQDLDKDLILDTFPGSVETPKSVADRAVRKATKGI